MTKRRYGHYCPGARALEVIGDRWALLVVRELLFGPLRYTDLLESLPGIGPNRLAARLKELQAHGIVAQAQLPPPAASTVYELTDLGRGLEPVMIDLFKWGLNFLGEPRPDDNFRPGWLMGAMRATFKPEAASGVRETYEFRVEGEVFSVQVDDRRIDVRRGSAPAPDVVVTTDVDTFRDVASGRIDPATAVAQGTVEVEGDPAALVRCTQMFEPPTSPNADQDSQLIDARQGL